MPIVSEVLTHDRLALSLWVCGKAVYRGMGLSGQAAQLVGPRKQREIILKGMAP